MKQKILYILFLITTALSWSLKAGAQTTHYVVNDPDAHQISAYTNSGGKEYTFSGPGATITFKLRKQGSLTTQTTYVYGYDTNNKETTLASYPVGDLTTTPTLKTIDIKGKDVKKIKIQAGGTQWKQFSELLVTRATTLSANSASLAFGNVKYGTSSEKSINVTYNNTYSGAVLTGTCTNPAFTVTRTNMGETGTQGITITYNANALGQQTGTVTLTMGTDGKNNNVTTTFTVSGTGVIDYNYEAATGVNRSTFGSASVAFNGGTPGTTANTSVQNTTEASVNKTAVFSAAANTGYEFAGWGTTANATSYESTANPYNYSMTATLSAPSQSKTLYAIFKPVFNFSATATSSNNDLGTATASVGNTKILGDVDAPQESTTATFTATPADDCIFKGWYENADYSGSPVSNNTTYTVTLTNSEIGSTATKTLYALFKKKQNLQWVNSDLDLNLVNGQNYSSAASVTSGKTITYTTDNALAVTIETDGTIHAVGLGDAHVTASVEGDEIYDAEIIERDFSVGEIKQATFTPAWGEGASTDIKVDGSTSIGLTNIANDGTFTISASSEGIISWNREGNTLTISAVSAGTTTLTLSQQGSAVLAGNQAAYTISVSKYPNTFALADETKAMKVDDVWEGIVTNEGNGNTQVSYSVEGIATYDAEHNTITAIAEGSTVITFTQEATTNNEGASKSINVTVTKVVNTLSVTLANTEVEVDGTINLVVAGRISDGATHAIISDVQLSSEINNGTDVITYANNVITACNAGTAKIRFTQEATNKYTAYESETYTITVNKISNAITVTLDGEQKNSKNIGHEATIVMGLSSTSESDAFLFTRISGTDDIATINPTSIVSGTTDGTSIWEISQAETYKYIAATTTVRVKVNSIAEEEGFVYTGWTDGSEYSWSTISGTGALPLSGPGETFTFQAKATAIAGFWNSTNFYAQYSTDGGSNWTNALTIQLPDRDKWYDFTCTVPENATHVRLVTQTGATGNKQVRNIKVTRKTYVRATASQTNLGEVFTDKTVSTTFNVSYSSTNGGDIEILSNNPRFTVDTENISTQNRVRRMAPGFLAETQSITVDNHSDNVSDPVVVTVTYTPDPNVLGSDEGVITISDRYYSTELTFTSFAKKYPTSIQRGSNTATETTVDGTINNVFAFTGTSTATPSADADADFYYTIASTYTSDVHTEEGVITYDPSTNTVTGRNAGTARLTIYQKSTDLYAATSQTFDFTVNKLANPVNIALSANSIAVDGIATVQLTNDDGKGALSVVYSNISYTNESMNQEGGFLSYNAENKTLTAVNAGTATVTVTQAETYKYLSKSQQFNVTINKVVQTLTWDNPDLETTMQRGATLTGNTATSDAGLTPVTYTSSNTAAITVETNTGVLTAVSTGANITITASQAGNYKYAPATLARQFSVFNKQTPAFNADENFSGANGRIEYEKTATITLSGVSSGDDFTISGWDNNIIDVVRNDNVITITTLNIGNTTLTLSQEGNDDYIAKTQTYNIEVYEPADYLTLSPTSTPTFEAGVYRRITLSRTLKAGYSTIALPFNTNASEIADGAWVAQLTAVTYNAQDGYTLFFTKVESGDILANQPYVLHLDAEVATPVWNGSIDVVAPVAGSVTPTKGYNGYDGWSMVANYTAGMSMKGKYGIVNGDDDSGLIMLGGTDSRLNAYCAYFAPPVVSDANIRLSFLSDETMDIEDFNDATSTDGNAPIIDENSVIYNINGTIAHPSSRGILIIDGKKVSTRR